MKRAEFFLSRAQSTGGTEILTGTGSALTGKQIHTLIVKSDTATITAMTVWKNQVENTSYDEGILDEELEKDDLITFDGVLTSITFGVGEKIMAYKEDDDVLGEHLKA
jgi:hypothetical protein